MMILSTLLMLTGGLCLFLYGMNIMSDGLQKSAGDRLRKTLNFMTGNRFMGLLTGFIVTAIIQSSSATSVMVVSFVNAGLLTLTQSIGVIMGANIGTTVTAWIVSLLGFSMRIADLALPAIGIGFILKVIKWKHKSFGDFVMGFGLLFLGLEYLTQGMRGININYDFLSAYNEMGALSIFIGVSAGTIMTVLIHSSSATIAIVLTMAFSGLVSYVMAASMILGANIGTTIDAILASIGAKTEAKRTALSHVLFNIIGTCWAISFLLPLLKFVDVLIPGDPLAVIVTPQGVITGNAAITTHLAAMHTIVKVINTVLFLPFVNQYAKLVSFLIKEKDKKADDTHYHFAYLSTVRTSTPELNILRAEKEIRDLAGIASSMYTRICDALPVLRETEDNEAFVNKLVAELKLKEDYADEMREALFAFLMECTRQQLNLRSELRVSRLLRVIANLEDITDGCYGVCLILERGVRKGRILKDKEIKSLEPYFSLVQEFLNLVQNFLGKTMSTVELGRFRESEEKIIESRKKLRKLGRRRIKEGENIKRKLLYMEIARSIEKISGYCLDISKAAVT